MKIAFVFPGQGAQVVGMGRELAEAHPLVQETFDEASEALDLNLSKLCWEGPETELKQTYNTQPALLTLSVAILRVIQKIGIPADFVAGHSVGEYAALVAAGVVDLPTAVRLTRLRGKLMDTACPSGNGGMAAILGLERAKVLELCKQVEEIGIAAPAAFNSPGQVVIAGAIRPLTEVVAQAKASGAISATMLPVSGPFHSPLMQPAAQGLKDRILEAGFKKAKIPVVCNVDALPHRDPTELCHNLIAQLTMPVRWQDSIEWLIAQGVRTFVEMGSGRVLTGLLRRINRSTQGCNVQDANSLEKTLGYFRSNADFEVGEVVDSAS
jgi:[acyl-carrier-protein] S-malonyltransferase